MRQGLILLGHGARDPRWRDPFERLAARIREMRPELPVSLAFLELMAPDLLSAGEALVVAGCDAIQVVPVFFGQGGHVRDDVPTLVEALQRRYSDVDVRVSPAAGENGRVIDALADFSLGELHVGEAGAID